MHSLSSVLGSKRDHLHSIMICLLNQTFTFTIHVIKTDWLVLSTKLNVVIVCVIYALTGLFLQTCLVHQRCLPNWTCISFPRKLQFVKVDGIVEKIVTHIIVLVFAFLLFKESTEKRQVKIICCFVGQPIHWLDVQNVRYDDRRAKQYPIPGEIGCNILE